jgi:hypothetical protein
MSKFTGMYERVYGLDNPNLTAEEYEERKKFASMDSTVDIISLGILAIANRKLLKEKFCAMTGWIDNKINEDHLIKNFKEFDNTSQILQQNNYTQYNYEQNNIQFEKKYEDFSKDGYSQNPDGSWYRNNNNMIGV